jgi:hypothetical protein
MAERKRRKNRRRKTGGSHGFNPSPFLDMGAHALGITPNPKPETMLMVSVAGAVLNYAFSKFFPHLVTQASKPHPEKAEPITTKIDEYQAGRSAVIREVARSKPN